MNAFVYIIMININLIVSKNIQGQRLISHNTQIKINKEISNIEDIKKKKKFF